MPTVPVSENILRTYSNYTRPAVRDIFAPHATYVSGTGTWGNFEIIELEESAQQLIETTPGDFVFFVTFGQGVGQQRFGDVITESGYLFWRSQPWMGFLTPRIQQFIKHDSSKNNIFLFLRIDSSNPYTYLGKLEYHNHDLTHERPVYLGWRILNWAPSAGTLRRIGLDLRPDSIAVSPDIDESIFDSFTAVSQRSSSPEYIDDEANLANATSTHDTVEIDSASSSRPDSKLMDELRVRVDQYAVPLTHLEMIVLGMLLGLNDGRERSVQQIAGALTLTDAQVQAVIDAALNKMGRDSGSLDLIELTEMSVGSTGPIVDLKRTKTLNWQRFGILQDEERLPIDEEWTEIEIISELGIAVDETSYLPVLKVKVVGLDEEKYWVVLDPSIKESLEIFRIANLGSLISVVVNVRLNAQSYNYEVARRSITEQACSECGANIDIGALIFHMAADVISGVDCHSSAESRHHAEPDELPNPIPYFRKTELTIRHIGIPRFRWCTGCSRSTNQFVVSSNPPLMLKCQICGSIAETS